LILIEIFQHILFIFSYYIFCVGSRSGGYLRLGIQARMHETTLTATTSSLVLNEIQRIDVTATVVPEQQVKRNIFVFFRNMFFLFFLNYLANYLLYKFIKWNI